MKDKNGAVDFPGYDPEIKHLPFPPTGQDYEEAKRTQNQEAEQQPAAKQSDVVSEAEQLDEEARRQQDARRTQGKQPGFTKTSVEEVNKAKNE